MKTVENTWKFVGFLSKRLQFTRFPLYFSIFFYIFFLGKNNEMKNWNPREEYFVAKL